MHTISAIELKAPIDNAIRLRLSLDGRTVFRPPTIERGQPLAWTNTSINIQSDSNIVVKTEKRNFRVWNKLATFKVPADDQQLFSGSKREIHISEKGCKLTIKFTSDVDNDLGHSNQGISTTKDTELPQPALDMAVQVVEAQAGSLLGELGRARDAVNLILAITGAAAEVHPFAKLALLAVTAAYDHLQKEEESDNKLVDLAHDMSRTLSFVVIVEDRAKIEKLKLIVKEMMELVKNASHFIIDYFAKGRLNRTLHSVFWAASQDRIAEFTKCFEKLRNAFNDGVAVQVLDLFCSFEEDRRLDALRRVIPSECRPSYNPDNGCMEGTRVEILNEIVDWVINTNTTQRLFWLHGLAGTGKTAIACSVCHKLSEREDGRQYLGASFFCKRDDKYLRNPTLVLPKIAASLATSFPAYGKLVAAAISNDPELPAVEAITCQFTDLFKGPLKKLFTLNRDPLAIVIDALDEMGTDDDRRRLIAILNELSELAPWLKIILTSRPDPEIRRFLERPERNFRDFDLNTHGSYDDILAVTRARMREIAESQGLPSNWPEDGKILALAQRSVPLFIWVNVAAAFIKGSMEPDERLDHILMANSSGSSYDRLDSLYSTAITTFFGGEDNARTFRDVVGAVVVVSSHTPLPCPALISLLTQVDANSGERAISGHAVERAIDALASVVYKDASNNGAIRLCHPSFMDFLTKSDRGCPPNFRINMSRENTRIAKLCFRTMMDKQCGLKFNICDLESSYQMNADIEGFSDRVKAAVSAALRYSSLHWAIHLTDAATENDERAKLYELLKQFFDGDRPLFWLEVLSLIGEVKAAVTSLLLVIAWIDDVEDEYSRRAADLHRFVLAFFRPISQSTPHIYISALAFSPKQCITSRLLRPLFPHTLAFTRGQKEHWSPCLRTLDGHSDSIWFVAVSNDGKMVASGSADKTIRIWDVETGIVLIGALEGHTDCVTSGAFSPDGRKVTSGSYDHTVRVWDIESGAPTRSFQGHTNSVATVAFSSDGRHVVSGSYDRTVRIWDVNEGVSIVVWEGHEKDVNSVAFSPNGHHVVSGSADCTIRLWDMEKPETILDPFQGHQGTVWCVAFSPDGQRIVSASHDNTVRIWDSGTGAPLFVPLTGHTNFVFCAAFSPADSRFVVSCGGDQTIRIWDIEAGTSVGEPFVGHSAIVWCAVFTPNGRYIVSGSSDKTIRVWDVSAGAAVESVEGHNGIIWTVAVSPNGQRIASGGNDKTIRIWDVETGAMIGNSLDGHNDGVNSVAFSSDGGRVASGSNDRTARIWDVETRVMITGPLEGHSDGILSVVFSPDDALLASGSFDNTIRIWDGNTGVFIRTLEGHSNYIRSVTFSSNGQHIASSSNDKAIHVWDIGTGATIKVFEHDDAVNSAAFSPDGRRLVSCSEDLTVRIWDLETHQSVTLPEGHSQGVISVAFSRDGKRVISGSMDMSVRVWDADSYKPVVRPLEGHGNTVYSVAPLPDGRIVSSSADQTIHIWTIHAESVTASVIEESTVNPQEEQTKPLPAHTKPLNPRMMVPTTRTSTQVMDDYGWITEGGNALLWVPADYRPAFIQPAMIIPTCNISIDYSNFLHGPSWVNIRG